MITSDLNVFGRGTDLIVRLRPDVLDLLTVVEAIAGLLEVVLHQVDVLLISAEVNPRVSYEDDAELVEALSDFLALDADVITQLALIALHRSHVELEVNDWDVLEVVC